MARHRYESARPRLSSLVAATAGLWLCTAALAQEGFPLDGTWRARWDEESGNRRVIVVVMKWDGERINGTIDPGPRSVPFREAELEPSSWGVYFAAEDRNGDAIAFRGTLTDIGSYSRRIVGTWIQAGAETRIEFVRE